MFSVFPGKYVVAPLPLGAMKDVVAQQTRLCSAALSRGAFYPPSAAPQSLEAQITTRRCRSTSCSRLSLLSSVLANDRMFETSAPSYFMVCSVMDRV